MEIAMSIPIRFDKLKFVRTLEKEANQSSENAEAFAKAIDEALEQSQSPLATKADLKELSMQLDAKLAKIELSLSDKISSYFNKAITLIISAIAVATAISTALITYIK